MPRSATAYGYWNNRFPTALTDKEYFWAARKSVEWFKISGSRYEAIKFCEDQIAKNIKNQKNLKDNKKIEEIIKKLKKG